MVALVMHRRRMHALATRIAQLHAAAPGVLVTDRGDEIIASIEGVRHHLASNHDEVDGELRRNLSLVDRNRLVLESIDMHLEKISKFQTDSGKAP